MSFRNRQGLPLSRGDHGMTLIEVVAMVAIVGVVIIPLSRFVSTMLKGFVRLETRFRAQEVTGKAMVQLERDLRDMNEVSTGTVTRLDFFMDRYRDPTYRGNIDDGPDGVINRLDVDDDDDGFSSAMSARTWGAFSFVFRRVFWRGGLDLEDDDDNNDGFRDVTCRYEYLPAKRTLTRSFKYNNKAFTPPEIIAKDVSNFSFGYWGSASFIDPNTGKLTTVSDTDGDSELSQSEIEAPPNGNANSTMDLFNETRNIIRITYFMEIQPNKNFPYSVWRTTSSVTPPLMALKEKFR